MPILTIKLQLHPSMSRSENIPLPQTQITLSTASNPLTQIDSNLFIQRHLAWLQLNEPQNRDGSLSVVMRSVSSSIVGFGVSRVFFQLSHILVTEGSQGTGGLCYEACRALRGHGLSGYVYSILHLAFKRKTLFNNFVKNSCLPRF